MDLEQKIKLIDELIKENPDCTIADYFETIKDIEFVEQAKPEDMNTPKHYSPEDAGYIVRHHKKDTARQIAIRRGLDEAVVRNFGSRRGLVFAKAEYEMTKERDPRAIKPKPAKFKRPMAVYSNQGFLSTIQKYAV